MEIMIHSDFFYCPSYLMTLFEVLMVSVRRNNGYSTDTEDIFEKIQLPFIIKTLNKLGIEGNFLNLLKDIYEKLTDNFIVSGEGLGVFSL